MNRHELHRAIIDYENHRAVMKYCLQQADDTEKAIRHFEALNSDDRQKLDEAISLMQEVADRHDEKAKELNEEYGPL